MTRRNFSKFQNRSRIARRGSESINGDFVPSAPPRKRRSKAEERAEAQAAVDMFGKVTKRLECGCGHWTEIQVPIEKARGPFRCSKCLKRIR